LRLGRGLCIEEMNTLERQRECLVYETDERLPQCFPLLGSQRVDVVDCHGTAEHTERDAV
jgi:hypothetical protein